jgi:hypothetical protein
VSWSGSISLLLIATACSRAVPSDTISPPPDFRVELERTGCLGPCPQYVVRVDQLGLVSFEGAAFVTKRGSASWQVSQPSLGKLARSLRERGILGFSQEQVRATCDLADAATDAPTEILRVTAWGHTTALSHYQGCSETPVLRAIKAACRDVDVTLATDKLACDPDACRQEWNAERRPR